MLQHFLGLKDSKIYLDTLTKTKDYNKAQEAVNDSITKRIGYLPKNTPIKDYLEKFNNLLTQ